MRVFSRIIDGSIPCHKIAENDLFLAFLDIEPIKEGHVLVVPKVEVNKIFDADDEYLAQWLLFAKPIAKALERAFPCKRCGISVIGLEVPHAHMHLVPINSADDLNFTKQKMDATEEELKMAQERILAELK